VLRYFVRSSAERATARLRAFTDLSPKPSKTVVESGYDFIPVLYHPLRWFGPRSHGVSRSTAAYLNPSPFHMHRVTTHDHSIRPNQPRCSPWPQGAAVDASSLAGRIAGETSRSVVVLTLPPACWREWDPDRLNHARGVTVPETPGRTENHLLPIVAIIADVAAIVSLLVSGLTFVVAVAALLAFIIGISVFARRWGKPVDKWAGCAVVIMVTGAVVFTVALMRPGGETASPSTTGTSFVASPSTAGATTSASGDGYMMAVDGLQLSVPYVEYCDKSQRIDIDALQVGPGVDGTDVWLFPCTPPVFQADAGAKAFGKGPTVRPMPQACIDLAKTQPLAPVLVAEFVAGETAFCVITHKQAVGWLRYTGKRDSNLIFELTLWRLA
jgi:hypothetical protein